MPNNIKLSYIKELYNNNDDEKLFEIYNFNLRDLVKDRHSGQSNAYLHVKYGLAVSTIINTLKVINEYNSNFLMRRNKYGSINDYESSSQNSNSNSNSNSSESHGRFYVQTRLEYYEKQREKIMTFVSKIYSKKADRKAIIMELAYTLSGRATTDQSTLFLPG